MKFFNKYEAKWKNIVYAIVSVLALVMAFSTILFFIFFEDDKIGKIWAKAFLIVWAIIPPFWFWFEYFFMWKPESEGQNLDEFKYGHEVSRNVWVAFVALLITLYLK